MKKRPTLLLLILGLASSFLGYLLAYLLFHETLIAANLQGGSIEFEQWLRGILEDITFQLICGFPPAIFIGVAIVLLVISSNRYKKASTKASFLIAGFCGLIWGFIFYFPYQFFILIASAF